MVKDHSDSERGNALPPHGLLFPINSKGSFISHRQDSTYHDLCYTSRGALAGTRIFCQCNPTILIGDFITELLNKKLYTVYTINHNTVLKCG